MSRARRRPAGPPRCRDCKAPIAFFGSPFTGSLRAFDPRPADAHQLRPSYPVENNTRAWRDRDLVEDLMVRTGITQAEAEEEAAAMPRHTLHTCPITDTEPEEGHR